MSDSEACQYIIRLVYDRCRIRLHQGKEALIHARLGKRMRHRGFADLAEYCHFLKTSGDNDELRLVVDALTTNFTSFLREEDHFKFLVQNALPSLLSRGERRFKIWSAACSSGEEPYSIGVYLSEHYPPGLGWDWQISASDISTKVLTIARSGIYPEERVRALPREWLQKYFQLGTGRWTGHYRVKPALASRISFAHLNLIEDYDHPCSFHVIFCRNVMIYFDRPTQEQLVRRLSRFLVPKGYLLIGHSESLNGLHVPLRCLRPSIYQKDSL